MRTHQLTPEQTSDFRKCNIKSKLASRLVNTMIQEILNVLVTEEEEYWDNMYQITGADFTKHDLSVNLATGVVNIKDKEEL